MEDSASQVDPSGEAMPVGDLPGWRQIFTDNFATPVPLGSFPAAVSSKWTAYSGFTDTYHNGTYDPAKVISIANGVMTMHLHTENGVHLVSAPIPIIPGTKAYQGQTYGRYAVRFRADPVAGYKTAWLLWPDDDNWQEGEIDFPEGNLDGQIDAFMHHRGSPQTQEAYPTSVTYNDWHTAVVEWTLSSVKYILDGNVIGNDTIPPYCPTARCTGSCRPRQPKPADRLGRRERRDRLGRDALTPVGIPALRKHETSSTSRRKYKCQAKSATARTLRPRASIRKASLHQIVTAGGIPSVRWRA